MVDDSCSENVTSESEVIESPRERAEGVEFASQKPRQSAPSKRLAFLAQASCVLASALDYESLDQVVRLAVPYMADWCVVDILTMDGGDGQNGSLVQVSVSHVDSQKELRLRLSGINGRPEPVRSNLVRRVLATGTSEVHSFVNDASLGAPAAPGNSVASDDLVAPDDSVEELPCLWLHSAICVPLRVRGEFIGAITFVCGESGREYDADDLTIAEALARMAAIALENARLYHEAEDARAEAEAARRRIEREDAAKDRFLAMLAHELRNPLGAIANAVQVIRVRGSEDEALQRAIDIVERQVKHQSRLVDDLLDISRIAHEKMALEKRVLDLGSLVADAVDDHRRAIEKASLKLEISLPGSPVWILADPLRVTQILNNLVHNALKFTAAGGTVNVQLDIDDSMAVVTVEDNGAGISPEKLSDLFQPFSQADPEISRGLGGLGLGLALVRGLAELHGGRVAGASAGPGQGSAFSVWLPLTAPPADCTEKGLRSGDRRQRILLIEDDLDSGAVMKDLLELFGHHVFLSRTGPDGLKDARRYLPDVVLCDIGLPGLDGYAVAEAIRSDPELASCLLIAVTGFSRDLSSPEEGSSGFDFYLTKPINPEELEMLLSRRLVGTEE